MAEHHAPTKLNLYPVKRDLEKQIQATTEELAKAEREADGLAKMMNTYQSHPKYGKADTFREELKAANLRVQDIEKVLRGLKDQHADIDRKLESLKGGQRGDAYTPVQIQRNNQARISSSPSIKSSLSVGSSSGRDQLAKRLFSGFWILVDCPIFNPFLFHLQNIHLSFFTFMPLCFTKILSKVGSKKY